MREVVLVLLEVVTVIGAILALGAMALDERFMTLWIGPGKYAGHLVVVLFALWTIASGLQNGLYNVVFGLGDVPALWRSSRLDTAIRLPILVVLLRPLGLWAAPAAALAGSLAGTFVFLRRLRDHLGVSWTENRARVKSALRVPLAGAVVAVVYLALPAEAAPGWLGFLSLGALYLIVVAGLAAFLHRSQLRAVALRRFSRRHG